MISIPAANSIAGGRLLGTDVWILARAEQLVRKCLDWYGEYAFHKVYRAIYDFVAVDLSSIYFDISKDRLYTGGRDSLARRSGQTAFHRLNLALVRLLAPVLSYTCEEVWQHSKLPAGAPDSVHLTYFPEPESLTEGITESQRAQAADWDLLVPVREEVLKGLDAAREDRMIGSSLEAAAAIYAGPDLYPLLERHAADLPAWFIVSQVELHRAEAGKRFAVTIDRARGDKCERCWKYTTDVGSNADFPTICAACASVIPEFLS